jgi:hypothetical protein
MHRTLLGLPLVLALIVACTTQAAGPTDEELIARLGHEDFAERDRAFQSLQERGPALLPALRKAVAHRDLEVRRQIEQLIAIHEAAAALAPKRVNLQAGGRSLAEVLNDVEKQTGYKVEVDEKARLQPVGLELKQVTFWEAIERLGTATGRRLTVPYADEKLHLTEGKGLARFVAHEGPFRLELVGIHEDRDLDFTRPGEKEQAGRHEHRLKLTVSIEVEPRFPVLMSEAVHVLSARDENGKILKVLEHDVRLETLRRLFEEVIAKPDYRNDVRFTLQRTDTGKTIKELRGTVAVQVAVDRKPIVVSREILKSMGTKCRIGPDDVEVQGVELENRRLSLVLRVPETPKGQREFWSQRVHIEDAEGNRYEQCGTGHAQIGLEYRVLLTYCEPDRKVGPPARLIIEEWTSLTYPVRFHFKEVPLP